MGQFFEHKGYFIKKVNDLIRVVKKKIKWLLLAVGLLILLADQWPDGRLKMVFCDVGQGDSILISKGEVQILVDGGRGDKVLACLSREMPFWDRQIEVVINTHPEEDHIGGLEEVLERYQVGRVIVSDLGEGEARRIIEERGIEVYKAKKGDLIKVGEVSLKVLWPQKGGKVLGASSLNEQSLVLLGSYGRFDWLLTGDIGTEVEESLDGLRDVEVLKVAHHGSRFSSGEQFLREVKAELAVIQVGKNSFGHPTGEVIGRLENSGARVMRNDIDGDIKVVSDGEKWWVE